VYFLLIVQFRFYRLVNFIAYSSGGSLARMWRDVKNEARVRSVVTGIVQRSKADSTSLVKDQGECRRTRDAKPEVTDRVVRYAIRCCWPEPQSKDFSCMLMSRSPVALRICTFHDDIGPIITSMPRLGIECLIACFQDSLI